MASKSFTAGLALVIGVGAGLACGNGARPGRTTLPKAGSDDDDGTGTLARLSRGQRPRPRQGQQGQPGGDPYTDPYYGGDWYGYGGDGYGYGGDAYGVQSSRFPPPTNPPPPTGSNYTVMPSVPEPGAIEGVVSWKGARPPAKLPAVASAGRCPGPIENQSLELSSSGGVRRAVVYLVDIRAGKAAPYMQGGTVEALQCGFSPRVQIAAPIGVLVQLSNLVESELVVRVNDGAGGELKLAPRGDVELTFDREGIYQLGSPSEHPGAGAWVVVPPHPYYTITDANGHFRLDDVPPGEYTLVVWHEPVATGVDAKGALQTGGVLTVKTKVKVKAFETATARVELK